MTVFLFFGIGICTGPRREFWACLCKELASGEHRLFTQCDEGHIRWVGLCMLEHQQLVFVGKCTYLLSAFLQI